MPWLTLLALIGGTWSSVFGAFTVLMSSSRFIKEKFTKRRQKTGRTTPDHLYKSMEPNTNTLGHKQGNITTGSMYRSQIKASAKFPEPIEDIPESEMDASPRSIQIRPKAFAG